MSFHQENRSVGDVNVPIHNLYGSLSLKSTRLWTFRSFLVIFLEKQ